MADQGGRMLSEDVHKRPWDEYGGEGNLNRPSADSRPLTRLIQQEDYKVYALEAVHFEGSEGIIKLNQEILKKVNNMVKYRMEYRALLLKGAPVEERSFAALNFTNTKKRVLKFQESVKCGGGTYFEIPKEIDDVPEQ